MAAIAAGARPLAPRRRRVRITGPISTSRVSALVLRQLRQGRGAAACGRSSSARALAAFLVCSAVRHAVSTSLRTSASGRSCAGSTRVDPEHEVAAVGGLLEQRGLALRGGEHPRPGSRRSAGRRRAARGGRMAGAVDALELEQRRCPASAAAASRDVPAASSSSSRVAKSGSWLAARSRLSSRRSSSLTVLEAAAPARARSRCGPQQMPAERRLHRRAHRARRQREAGLRPGASGRSPFASGPSSERSTLASFSASATCGEALPGRPTMLGRALDRRLVAAPAAARTGAARACGRDRSARRRRPGGRRR